MTTAGGIEEDFIKCLAHTYLGDFNLSGQELRQKGINRWATAKTIQPSHSCPQVDAGQDVRLKIVLYSRRLL